MSLRSAKPALTRFVAFAVNLLALLLLASCMLISLSLQGTSIHSQRPQHLRLLLAGLLALGVFLLCGLAVRCPKAGGSAVDDNQRIEPDG